MICWEEGAMNPRLIKASIAMFNGAKSESRRLLDEYLAEENGPLTPQVMWLDAQTQNEREERLGKLRILAEAAGSDDRYGLMALEVLRDERKYGSARESRSASAAWNVIGVPLWKVLSFTLLGAVIIFLGLSL